MADILGSFEQAVLLAIVRLESGAYGRAILKEVRSRLERDVAAGAVQATLERLERKGLVRSKWEAAHRSVMAARGGSIRCCPRGCTR